MPSVPVCELRYIFDFDFNSLFVRLSLIFLQAVINQCKVSRRSSTRAIWLIDSIVCHSPNQPPTPLWAPNPQKSFLFFGVCFDQFEFVFFIVAIERRT